MNLTNNMVLFMYYLPAVLGFSFLYFKVILSSLQSSDMEYRLKQYKNKRNDIKSDIYCHQKNIDELNEELDHLENKICNIISKKIIFIQHKHERYNNDAVKRIRSYIESNIDDDKLKNEVYRKIGNCVHIDEIRNCEDYVITSDIEDTDDTPYDTDSSVFTTDDEHNSDYDSSSTIETINKKLMELTTKMPDPLMRMSINDYEPDYNQKYKKIKLTDFESDESDRVYEPDYETEDDESLEDSDVSYENDDSETEKSETEDDSEVEELRENVEFEDDSMSECNNEDCVDIDEMMDIHKDIDVGANKELSVGENKDLEVRKGVFSFFTVFGY